MSSYKALQKVALLLLTLLLSPSMAQQEVNERDSTDPPFTPIENQFLIFPMTEKDFWNWNSVGSAVFLRNKAILAPEVSNRKGAIHTMVPNSKPDHWYAVLDFNIGRDKVKEMNKSGEGFAIHYLRNMDSGNPDINSNFYGFQDDFDGIGIFINTMQMQRAKDKSDRRKLVSVSSFANDGKRMNKQTKPDTQCFKELTGSHLHFSKISIEYEKPILSVNVYDHESASFQHCFSQQIELDYEGFFVISASSGTVFPQYNQVNSFKVFDPTVAKLNHHFEDSHRKRAEHDQYAEHISMYIGDLIHQGAVESGENALTADEDELRAVLPVQAFYASHRIQDANVLLQQMQHHFHQIVQSVDMENIYDHSLKLNQDLFQTYFNMSVSIAQELNYLEAKDDELDVILKKQIEEGDVAARNRRRKGSEQSKPRAVDNRETQRLAQALKSLQSKIVQISEVLDQLENANIAIMKKSAIADDIAHESAQNRRARAESDRDRKLEIIKSKIDFRDVEDIFDDVIDEQLQSGVIFSAINMSMMCVMAASAFLWFKLDKAEAI